MASAPSDTLSVVEERSWSEQESRLLANPLFENFAHFARFSTARTVLSIAKVRRGGDLIGVAPLLRLVKYRGTRLLEPRSRRWLDPWLGPFAKKTTCLVDASFTAFRHEDPFLATHAGDERAVREAVVAHLKRCRDVDSVLISEPAGDPGWFLGAGFRPFLQLPLVYVDVEGFRDFDEHLARIGQKRRRNTRKERELLAQGGGAIELHESPLDGGLARELHACLQSSSRRNSKLLEIPYEDVMNSEPAFASQRQSVLVARVHGAIAGFFGFIEHGGTLHQCHGGLHYEHSLAIKAYPNLIHAAVEHAIARGARRVSLGPLNNEAKRRAGQLAPVMAGLWCRDAASRFLMNRVLLGRFQVYGGEVGAAAAPD